MAPGDHADMNGLLVTGGALSIAGVAGYLLGLFVVYPGRAFSLTVVMVGLTLLAIGVGENR